MSCCGRLRSAVTPPQTIATSANPGTGSTGSAFTGAAGWVALRYLDRAPITVAGPHTRRPYRFSGAAPVQPVDLRDAQILLRTRYFRPA